MRRLSALDLAFFLAETEGSPKHVAGLMLFRKPPGAERNFCRRIVEDLKASDRLTEPFNLVIEFVGLRGPHWRPCDDFDIDQHIFYHGRRKVISWEEALEFAARLHEPLLDRSRPLWEYHLIDGIEGARFAVYTKIHHAYADGVTMTRWVGNSLSDSPDDPGLKPVWSRTPGAPPQRPRQSGSITGSIRSLTSGSWNQVLTAGGMAKLATQQYLEKLGITHRAVSVPFSTDHQTPLTGSASPGRTIATAALPMERVKSLCAVSRSTLNHLALSCIDGALHRYLDETGNGIDHPITIQMPVNLRQFSGEREGNSVGVALVELADPGQDAYGRLLEVGHSLSRVKDQIRSVPGDAMQQYTVLLAMTGELIDKLRLSNRLPTNGHTLVSNVPGPQQTLYLRGARLERMYPISILVPGLRMNITMFSCSGVLNFGIVATRDLPELGRLARCIEDEFDTLENALLQPDWKRVQT